MQTMLFFIRRFFILQFLFTAVLLSNSCKKDNDTDNEYNKLSYISQEEFAGRLSGEWNVYRCNHYFADQPSKVTMVFEDEEVTYFNNEGSDVYSMFDTTICMLPEINKIQFWHISKTDSSLQLETDDLCGIHKGYELEFSNALWICPIDPETGNYYRTQYISADLKLISPDTMITLSEFILDTLHQSFDFRLDEGENSWLFRIKEQFSR